jgi:tetratricopeptide (TPR) repeat protein
MCIVAYQLVGIDPSQEVTMRTHDAASRSRAAMPLRTLPVMTLKLSTLVPAVLASALATGLTAAPAAAQDAGHAHAQAAPSATAVPLFDNLGTHHYPISSRVPRVAEYFDQGLRLYYAFNHAEAVRAFEEAVRLDPECAICYWGIGLAHGPNINAPMDSAAGVAAWTAVQRAQVLAHRASPVERALIEALAQRYASVPAGDRAALDSAYARAMGDVTRRHPNDREAAVLYVESLMDLRPWSYWTQDLQPQPGTTELLAVLERVIGEDPDHPGACHLYIHAVEAAHPERAVPCAERLAQLMPGAGHLVHMPGHIYIRVGRYMDAIRANEHAVHADESYIQDQRPGIGTYTVGYYPHNYDFLAFAASLAGRSEQALAAGTKASSLVVRELLREPGMTVQQQFLMRPQQLQVRFGQWDDILRTPAPDEDLLHARGLWHYARGRALAARGELAAAAEQLEALERIAGDPSLEGVPLEFNEARTILRIAVGVLAGQIAAGRGDWDVAIARLRDAAAIEDALTYGEPPEWIVPVRHDLGAVLLAAGRPADAEAVYREDLRRFPENGWSLHGLAESLTQQGRAAEAVAVREKLERAWQHADVTLAGSRFEQD